MSRDFRQHISDAYHIDHYLFEKRMKKKSFLQIDDQDDTDNIEDFCNIFVTFKGKYRFELELIGKMPITQEMADLAEIYHGSTDLESNKLSLTLTPKQIGVISDLVTLIRKTSKMGHLVGNPHWFHLSARTISSLNRFMRIIKEYVSLKQTQLV